MVYGKTRVSSGILCQERRYGMAFTDQRCGASIDELVLSPGWYNHEVASFDILVFAGDGCPGSTGSEGKSLVNSVDLWDRVQRQWIGW